MPTTPPLPVALTVQWLGRDRGEASLVVETSAQWELAGRACGIDKGRDFARTPLTATEMRLTLMRRPRGVLTVEVCCRAAIGLTGAEAEATDGPVGKPRDREVDYRARNAPGGSWDRSDR